MRQEGDTSIYGGVRMKPTTFPIVSSDILRLGSLYTIKLFKNWNAEGKGLPNVMPQAED